MSATESVKENRSLEMTEMFKYPSIYNETHFNIVHEGSHVGSYGNGVFLILTDYLPMDMLDWLATEIVCHYVNEIGYVFLLHALPVLKIVGARERKNHITFKVKSMLKFSPYYNKISSSKELLETLPFSPNDMKEEVCRKIKT